MIRLAFPALVFLEGTHAAKCISCYESQDHHGNALGNSGPGCFNGNLQNVDDYMIDCPSNQPYCGVEFFADWLPRGFQQFTVRRGCRAQPAPEECLVSLESGFKYKDCFETCSTDGCNSKNDVYSKAAELDETQRPRQIDCLSCSRKVLYNLDRAFNDFDTESDVDGNPFCYNQGTLKECPVFANAGCFKSKALADFTDGHSEEHYYKGCSTFPLKEDQKEDEPECTSAAQEDQFWLMCDNICPGQKGTPCNTGTATGGSKVCYTCEVTVDQAGEMVGWGDPSCLMSPHNYHLEVCAGDQDICVTEFKEPAEWKLLGEQHFTMRRGCSKSENFPQNNECLALNANNYKARECVETCRDLGAAGCNNGTEIFNQFAGDNVDKCRTCSDHIFGNQASKDCAKSESTSQKCPIYAKQGCFSSRVVYDTNMDQESDTYHGCSAFRTSNDEKSCFNVNVEDQFGQASDQKTTCKESCTTDDCNQDVTEIIDGPQSDHFCAVCTVRMDHFNNTIGEGDPRCWGEDIPSQFYTRCDEGLNFCVTDIEVDWAANGDQVTTLKRGCAAEPAPTECRSGAIQTWQYKDCSTTCSNNMLTACNVNMYDTALLFSDNSWGFDKTCFNCETHTGSPHPNDCGPNDGPIGGPESSRNIVKCPKYADHGCFTSILQHEENGEMIEDVIRGCSAFPQEYACSGWTERQLNDNGITTGSIEWNSCKEACSDSNNCNREQAVIAGDNRCYACTAQVDSHGDVYGIGQEFCFSNDLTSADESLIVDCGKDSYCLTDMEVDWYPQGEQITTIRRRCASEEIVNNCETSIANGWAMKDCYTTCEGALCNKDLEVANLLSEQNVAECYSCKFTELSGSAHNDTMDCKTSPSEETIQACPVWASSACFVADAVVKDEQGDDLVNIYRGCSTFSPDQFGPMMKCSTITVDVGVDTNQPYRAQASTCKQLCSDGDDCNNIRYPDWQPPAEDECPPCEDGALATFFSLLFLLVLIL